MCKQHLLFLYENKNRKGCLKVALFFSTISSLFLKSNCIGISKDVLTQSKENRFKLMRPILLFRFILVWRPKLENRKVDESINEMKEEKQILCSYIGKRTWHLYSLILAF